MELSRAPSHPTQARQMTPLASVSWCSPGRAGLKGPFQLGHSVTHEGHSEICSQLQASLIGPETTRPSNCNTQQSCRAWPGRTGPAHLPSRAEVRDLSSGHIPAAKNTAASVLVDTVPSACPPLGTPTRTWERQRGPGSLTPGWETGWGVPSFFLTTNL